MKVQLVMRVLILNKIILLILLLSSNVFSDELIKKDSSFRPYLSCDLASSVMGYTKIFRSSDVILKAGRKYNTWGVFTQLEYNGWPIIVNNSQRLQAAINLGIGGELIYLGGRMKSSISAGPTYKLNNNKFYIDEKEVTLKEKGKVGFYIDIRHAGFIFRINNKWVINFDPITLNFEVPIIDTIPLFIVEYRTIVSVEYRL